MPSSSRKASAAPHKAIPWQIPDFSVDRYFARLKELERRVRTEGYITVRDHRFLLDATKPA